MNHTEAKSRWSAIQRYVERIVNAGFEVWWEPRGHPEGGRLLISDKDDRHATILVTRRGLVRLLHTNIPHDAIIAIGAPPREICEGVLQ